MIERNGYGMVYSCSDCGKNDVRVYAFGGDGNGSLCGTWGLTDEAIKYIHDHPEIYHTFQDVAEWLNNNK
jgi:hypothetical protein